MKAVEFRANQPSCKRALTENRVSFLKHGKVTTAVMNSHPVRHHGISIIYSQIHTLSRMISCNNVWENYNFFFSFINRKGQTCLMYIHYKWIFLQVFQRAQGSLHEKLDSKVLHTVGDHLFFHTAFTTQRHWMLKKSSYVEKTVFFIPCHILLLRNFFSHCWNQI